MLPVERASAAGRVVWWLNAVLAHAAAPDDAAAQLTGMVAFDGTAEPWPLALAHLRRLGVTHLNLRIVEPGDPLGLPGPPAVTQAAVDAGVALVSDDGGLTVLPVAGTARWQAVPSTATTTFRTPLGSLSDARRLMRTAMADLTVSFPGMEPDDAAMAQMAELRSAQAPAPAPGIAPEAIQVAGSALQVWRLTLIADGVAQRRGVTLPAELRELRPLARRAASVAFSDPVA